MPDGHWVDKRTDKQVEIVILILITTLNQCRFGRNVSAKISFLNKLQAISPRKKHVAFLSVCVSALF